jgi:hypothetical protein
MHDIPWSKPIRLEFPRRRARVIDGPGAALDILDSDWPIREGRHYEAARAVCEAARARLTSPEAARDIFISASIEAAVPIR